MTEAEKARLRAELRRRKAQGQAAPKPLGTRLWENIVGDDDPTTQNTGEKIGTFLNKAGEAMTFGLVGDEASAAAAQAIPGGQNYDDRLAYERQQERLMEESNPGAMLAAEIGGGALGAFLPGGQLGAMGRGAGMLKRMGAGAAAGAGFGGLYGFMEGEGVEDRLDKAQLGGGFGAVAGGAAAPVASMISAAGRGAGDVLGGALDNFTNRGSPTRAKRAIAQALARSGRSASQVTDDITRAAKEGQPEFRLMDAMGTSGQRSASGVVRTGGEGAEELAEFLQQRQLDQGNRVAGFTEDAFGYRGQRTAPGNQLVPEGHTFVDSPADVLRRPQVSAAQTSAALTKARDSAADQAFGAVRDKAAPVDIRRVVSILDDKISPFEEAGIDDAALSELRKLRGQLVGGGDGASFELSNFNKVFQIRRRLRDTIDRLYRAGESEVARDLRAVKNGMDEALEAASGDYKAAMNQFRSASGVIDAVDEGANMFRPGVRAADTTRQFSGMTPEQQAAARIGYGDRALAKIEGNSADTSNRARIFNSTKAKTEAGAMATDPRLFADRIGRENTMWETQNRALGGSRTADNLQDIGNLSPLANAGRAVRDVANLQLGSAGQNVAAALGPLLKGQSPATRKLIAEALMSRDAGSVTSAVSQSARDDAMRRLIESLVRRGGAAALQ